MTFLGVSFFGVTFDFFLGGASSSSSEDSTGDDEVGELAAEGTSEKDDSSEVAGSKYLLRWLWLDLRDFWGVGFLERGAAVDADVERVGRAMEKSM